MKNYTKVIAVVAAGLACAAATSKASITPGTFNSNISTTSEALPASAALTTLVSPYVNSLDAGTFTSAVYKGNVFGANDLTFVYTIVATVGDVGSITVNGFSGAVNAANVTSSPLYAGLVSYDPSGFLKFVWGPPTTAGETVQVIVDTSLTSYATAVGSVQDGQTSNVPTLAPVPEPTTVAAGALMLLPFGVGALRSLRKDRIA